MSEANAPMTNYTHAAMTYDDSITCYSGNTSGELVCNQFWSKLLGGLPDFFTDKIFTPYGHYYLWHQDLVLLHVISDALIFISYSIIPILLFVFWLKRKDIPFNWILVCFMFFIIFCGLTHLCEITTLWRPYRYITGTVKAITAVISVLTAILLARILIISIKIPSPIQYKNMYNELMKAHEELTLIHDKLSCSMGLQLQIMRSFSGGFIIALDLNKKFISAGGTDLISLLKVPIDEIEGRDFNCFADSSIRAAIDFLYECTLKAGTLPREIKILSQIYDVNSNLLYDSQSQLIGVLIVLQNSTVQRQNHEKICLMNEALEQRLVDIELSERKYHFLHDSISDGIVHLDLDGNYLEVNEAYALMLGFTPEELKGSNPNQFTPQRWHEIDNNMLERVKVTGQAEEFEKVLIHRDGSLIQISKRTWPETAPDGTVIGFWARIQNITQKRMAMAALVQLREIIAASSDAIFSLDLDGRITHWSPGAQKVYGYSEKESVGYLAAETYVPLTVVPIFDQILEQVRDGQRVEQRDTISVRKNGEQIFTSGSYSPIRDPNDGIIGISVVARDVTEQRKAEEKIRQLNEELEIRVKMRTQELEDTVKELESFNYSISHDLRTPLRAIGSYARIIEIEEMNNLTDRGHKTLQVIMESVDYMGDLINDLLNFSRVNKHPLIMREIKLAEITELVIAGIKPETGRFINFSMKDLAERTVQGDPILLRQVFINLISNAVKFTRNKEEAKIEIGSYEEGSEVVIYVKDNGAGFKMKYVHKLFGVFQRLHKPSEFEGTGVGLAIVQRIVQRHGGRVWAQGEEGKGATIFFTLKKGEK